MIAAAVLMAITFLVHLFLGGADLYQPLRASELPADLRSVFSVLWHFVSVQLLLMTLALCWLSTRRNDALFWFVLLTTLAFGALFVAYGINDLHSIWPMPQWIAFWGVSALMGAARVRR